MVEQPIPTTRLGRTGLEVSSAGLGCGGHSRLGLSNGRSEDEAVTVVERALELGVTLIDTAELYGTEHVLGRALARTDRDPVVCTKKWPYSGAENRVISGEDLRKGLHASLERLGRDRVEVYLLHGVEVVHYDEVKAALLPTMMSLRDEGLIGWVGITEQFGTDTAHRMMTKAMRDPDDCWDVVMVGFNFLNQSARERVLAPAMERDVGVLDMFAVRRALCSPDSIRPVLQSLIEQGELDTTAHKVIDHLLESGDRALTEVAYRFCRAEPGIDVVLTGTGDAGHLERNLEAIGGPPLEDEARRALMEAFGHLDTVSGDPL